MSLTAEEMDKIVEACSKFRQAKLQTEMEQLRKELEENSEAMPDEQPQEKKSPGYYKEKESCEKAGYHWYDGECHEKPKPELGASSEKQLHEVDKPMPDECGTKDKCLKYGYQWNPETGCGYPDKMASEKPGEQPEK